jgi:hypothetical protein
MSSILDSISQSLTPDLLGQVGKAVGLDSNLVRKGLAAVGPAVLGSLAAKAATPSGLDALTKLLPSGGGTGGLGVGDLLGMLKPGAGKEMLGGVFGAGTGAVTSTLDRKLGFKVGPLLAVAVPMVLGAIAKMRKTQNLDNAGLARVLQDEQKSFFATGGETATIVREALDAGREASAVKDRFTSEEWERIRLGPVAAASVVMMASPSGVVGTYKEVGSVLEALRQGQQTAAPTALVQVAFDEELSKDEFFEVAKGKSSAAVLDMVKGALATVSAKSPAEVASYRSLVLGTAQRVAEASKEGGFLGIGGQPVSREEQQALDELRNVLSI